MKVKVLLASLIVSLLLFSGCQKEKDLTTTSASSSNHTLKSRTEPDCATSFDLVAGQHYLAGSVLLYNDADSVYVGYVADGWTISAIHLYIGNCALIPVNGSGSPVPGRFPVSASFNPGITEVWYSFPRASLPDCGCLAAHAVVTNNATGRTETGWSKGPRFTNNNWSMRSEYCLCGRVPISEVGADPRHGRNPL